MRRRLNYTGRIRIPRERVSVSITSADGNSEQCHVVFNSEGISIAPDSRIYLEAYSRGDQVRFDLGTLSQSATHKPYSLGHLSNLRSVRFRLLVVESGKSGGRILAAADHLIASRPDAGDHDRRSILPVDFRDLGQEVWRLAFASDQVTLLLNRRIPDIRQMALGNDILRLTVLPAALREITLRLYLSPRDSATSGDNEVDDESDWRVVWRRFLSGLVGPDRLQAVQEGSLDDAWELAETASNALADGLTGEFSRLLRLREVES